MAVDEVRHGFEIVVREVAVVLGRVLAGAGGVHLRTDRLDLRGLAAGRRDSQQRRARLSTAGRPDTAAGDDTSLNSLGMANAGDEAEVEPEGSKARTSRNTPPRALSLPPLLSLVLC